MRLTHITIENFKGIRERVEIPLGPITLLFGANSAGKSTMLQALLYLRELLERQNADADLLSAGGTAIHLGGFRQLVHMHDLERVIRVGVTLELDDDGLPEYELPHEYDPSQGTELAAEPPAPFSWGLRTAGVEVSVAWEPVRDAPTIVGYSVFGDGALLATVTPAERRSQLLTIEQYHHAFGSFIDESSRYSGPHEVVGPLGFMASAILRLVQPTVVPRWNFPLTLEAVDGDEPIMLNLAALRDILRPVLSGIGELILGQLQKIRYIGPVREFPERGALAQRTPSDDRWASGLAAWDWLGRETDEEAHRQALERFGEVLTAQDQLNLGYSVRLEVTRQLSEESELYLLLESLRRSSEPEDLAEQLRKAVGSDLLSLPRLRRVVITDERNGAEVSPQDVGNGVTQVIPVVAGVLAPGGTILAVEQPELHLHPAIQCRLADLFVRAIHEQENRLFIIETHSEHLMLRLMRRVRETTAKSVPEADLQLTKDDLQVLYVESCDARTVFRQMPLNNRGEWVKEWPGGFFDEDFNEIF